MTDLASPQMRHGHLVRAQPKEGIMSRLDPSEIEDVSLLALKAAMEVEAIKRHEAISGYAKRLREVLLRQTCGDPTSESVRNLAPNTIEAYRRAAKAATEALPGNFNELSEVLKEVVADLENISDASKERRDRLVRFLTAVHDELLGKRQGSELRRRPSSRYRI